MEAQGITAVSTPQSAVQESREECTTAHSVGAPNHWTHGFLASVNHWKLTVVV